MLKQASAGHRTSLIEKVGFEQRLEGGEGVSHVDSGGRALQAEGTARTEALGREQ